MFPLFPKNPLFQPSRCSSSSSQVRNFLIRFPVLRLSSPPPPPQPHCNRLEEDKVRVSAWWDFDNCAVPSGVSYSKVAPSIMGALRTHGIKCPIDIEAYGNLSQLSEFNQEALFLTGINLHHVPGGKMHAHRYLMDWGFKNPAPAHLFIISGDRDIDFVGAVSQLRMRNYNILLACPAKTDYILCHTATIMWPWSSMLKGDFTGKHFNKNPPKWYGSKVPLENPFSAAVEPTSSQNVEIHKPSSNIKLDSEVPESVSRQVRKILRLYPNGISIGDLHTKLTKCDLPLDERFYGHEKFSDFLVSIPHVQLLDKGEDNFCVLLIPSTTSDNDIVRFEDTSPEILDKKPTSQNRFTCNDYLVLENNDIGNCESGKAENKHENPARKKVGEVCRSSYSSLVDDSLVEKKRRDGSAETSSKSSTCWISSWWTFWKSSAKSDDLTTHQDVICSRKPEFEDSKLSEVNQTASHFEEPKSTELQQDVSHSGRPELFSTDSFWDAMESFVFAPRGSCLISQSRSREDLGHRLQKHGPLVLRCLTKNDILQLVELLIANKKWLEESPSQAFPFRLTKSV